MIAMPILLESLVAVLLVVTLGYCVVLERRIRTFRQDQDDLRSLIAELDRATGQAEKAVLGLSVTTREAQESLDHRLNDARALTRSMAMMARTNSRHAGGAPRRKAKPIEEMAG